ncbi:Bgt-20955 [Blumeria graminis f. sp. tritici]|uniref:Bgt-20955 n=1 Tax=Blumeria graminis f. sp. tritici TaxID=62690 RepID=A0A9X9QCA3_BLUGR|nr:Bgt-20955 [Blumeria graminis f. sp. tritici]
MAIERSVVSKFLVKILTRKDFKTVQLNDTNLPQPKYEPQTGSNLSVIRVKTTDKLCFI